MLKTSHELRITNCEGFTLLEVLVALSILSTAIILIFQLFSANMRNIALSEDYVSATVTADARMRDVLEDDALTVNHWSETTGDGYRIDVAVSDALQQRTQALPVKLLEVVLTIYWTKNMKEKSFTLRTMKMVKRKI
ncbi:MAG: prepilin-type N-terminal cleavage/methylation domain-containing protein [Syntrophorhabdaceae bacterium]|nr:prepilin-type N-terminal cleavage/methylation domain-containing protein [Syntrophorhabdaceae bacterium]MDD5244926.1 prepilin-type N-terminal cleavage/methylation domain-containing protein [Syntrophorhabdaceae bacterium]